MYVKRYVVRRGRRQYVYLRLVEAFRDEQGRVRHRVLHTLGREDQLKSSGQLDQLAAAFTRLDPPLAGTRREVGPLLLVGHYLDRLGLVALVDRQLPQRGRAQLTHGEVAARLHLDLTCLRVAGAYEGSALVGKGWGPDRRVARQVRMLQATTPQGIALYVRPHPGDAAELACIGAALDRLRELLPPGLLVCADSVLGHVKNLCAADRAGLRFVVPLRADTGFAQRFLDEVGHDGLHRLDYLAARERHLEAARRTRYRGALRPFAVTDPDTAASHPSRVAYIWSSEEARSVADGRQRALAKAEAALGKVQRGLGGR